MPKSGDVLFYKDFDYGDGTKSNKLFVVLCSDAYCLVLKTTKDEKGFYRGANEGCNPKKRVFFIPKTQKEFFDLDTYVQLPQIIEISISDLLKEGISKRIKNYQSALSSKCLQSILDCLRNFKDDISDEHWRQIFSGMPNTPSINSLQKLASKFKVH